jgi:hypothetical protein
MERKIVKLLQPRLILCERQRFAAGNVQIGNYIMASLYITEQSVRVSFMQRGVYIL